MDKYNWDDIDVGRSDLDHSENFFAFKHSMHEKFSVESKTEIMMDEEAAKENFCGVLNQQPLCDTLECNKEAVSKSKILKENQMQISVKETLKSSELAEKHPTENFTTQQKSNIPTLLEYAEFYERRKQNVLKKQIEQDRKNRIFVSKPAPSFNKPREQKCYGDSKPMTTTAVTTNLSKNVAKTNEKWRKLLEDRTNKTPPPKFQAKEAKVLKKEPFIPKKENRFLTVLPFNLNVETRLSERKNYDEKIEKQMEERKRKEEEERIRREDELSNEFRKMTTFKARRNPFK